MSHTLANDPTTAIRVATEQIEAALIEVRRDIHSHPELAFEEVRTAGVVTREDIEDVVSRWTGVPVTSIKEEETQKLLRVEEELHKRIISQEKSISALARAIRRSRAGCRPARHPATNIL